MDNNHGKQASVSSEISLEEIIHGKLPCREEQSRRASWYSRITAFKLNKGPAQQVGVHVKIARGLYGWARNS